MVAAMLLAMPGCKRAAREVVVYTSVDRPFSEPIFREFEKRSGMKVLAVFDTEETKSTGVVNRLIAEAQQPQADVFWSGDPVRPFLLVKRGIVQPYESPAAAAVPAQFKAADGSWTGSAARARILLVNKQKVPPAEMPKSIRDLVAPRWKRQTAIANPLFGTTAMHVAALFALWGEDKGRAFLDELKTNETRIASSNGEVKRLVVAGEVAFGLCDTDAVESDPADRVRLNGIVASIDGRIAVPPEERHLAMVFQDLALWPHMTVREHLAFTGAAGSRIETVVQRVGLYGKEDRYPAQLSGGERQRVALARALAADPAALLLDEPLSNVDVALRRELIALLRELFSERRRPALLVTHDLREAHELANQIAVIEAGELVQMGTIDELQVRPATRFVEALLADRVEEPKGSL